MADLEKGEVSRVLLCDCYCLAVSAVQLWDAQPHYETERWQGVVVMPYIFILFYYYYILYCSQNMYRCHLYGSWPGYKLTSHHSHVKHVFKYQLVFQLALPSISFLMHPRLTHKTINLIHFNTNSIICKF